MNSAVAGGLDIVLHVPDEEGFFGLEIVLLENLMNLFALIPDAEVRPIQVRPETRRGGLNGKMIVMNRAQKEGSQLPLTAKLKEIARVGERTNGILDLFEAAVKPRLELAEGDVRHMTLIKDCERKAKLSPKLLQTHFRPIALSQNIVCGLPDCRQIIHQRPRPIKNNIPNHSINVTQRAHRPQRTNGLPITPHGSRW